MTRPSSVLIVLALAGCGDDIASDEGSGEGTTQGTDTEGTPGGLTSSSSGGGGSSTSGGQGSSTTNSTASSTSGSSTSGGPDSSTTSRGSSGGDSTSGGPAFGRARFLAKDALEPGGHRIALFTYEGGVLSEVELVAEAIVSQVFANQAGDIAAYRFFDDGNPNAAYAIDLSSEPVGAPQPFVQPPVPGGDTPAVPTYLEASGLFTFETTGDDGRALYVSDFTGGVLGTPEPIMVDSGLQSDARYDASGTQVTYRVGSMPEEVNVYVGSLLDPEPDTALLVASSAGQSAPIVAAEFVPEHEAVVYAIDDVVFALDLALYFVDITGGVASAPVRIDDPSLADPEARVAGPYYAPDGHALVYWAGTGLIGDLFMVDLESGIPGQPMPVESFEGTPRRDVRWSPDSRWLAYHPVVDDEETHALYVVDASGDVPGVPIPVADGLPVGRIVDLFGYDPDQWLYFIAPFGQPDANLFRVDLSGAAPSAAQRVSGRHGPLLGEMVPSRDWAQVMYTAYDENFDVRLYSVEVSGDEPGVSTRIDAAEPDVNVSFGARFSFDASAVLYRENHPGGLQPMMLRDLENGDLLPVAEDTQTAIPVANLD